MKSPYGLILFLFGFLLLPYSSADAAIRATFESPGDAQPVAGITTVQGWAFETALDAHISGVTLIIDGTLRQDIPCCSERGDIPLAFPALPAEQTLNSGWAMTFNWGLLSAGVHTLRVEIASTSGQIFSTRTRTITVIKPGEFEFLDQFDLSAAEPSILGNQLVLKGVKVRGKASKQTKTVNVRYRWFQNSQSLDATGSVTAEGSWEPRFVFGDQVSAEDQRNMRERLELAMYYVQEETGVWMNDFTVYIFADRQNFIDVWLDTHLDHEGVRERDRARIRQGVKDNQAGVEYTDASGAGVDIVIFGEQWFADEYLMAHEYFHVIQYGELTAFEAGVGSHDVVYKIGPAWLLEGSAIYVAVKTEAHEGSPEQRASRFAESKAWLMDRSQETAAPLQSMETYNGLKAADDVGYWVGAVAADFLIDHFGGLPALVSFYEAIGPGTTWQDAFQETFGMSIDEFYAEFEAYRLETFPPLP